MLDALIALFERVCRNGLPLVLGTDGLVESTTGEGLPELDAPILGLLLAGLTDQAMASQLGLLMSTVQGRVRALMDLVAAESGWL